MAENHDNMTDRQIQEFAWLLRPSLQLATMRAWRWRIDFDGFFTQHPDNAEAYLKRWCNGAKRSRLEPIKDFVKLVYEHWDGILAWHHSPISNGILEGTNNLIQAAKRKARGYRNTDNLITIIYLIAGRLPLPTPHTIWRRANKVIRWSIQKRPIRLPDPAPRSKSEESLQDRASIYTERRVAGGVDRGIHCPHPMCQ